MAASLRILFTNNTLDARAGSEIYVRDAALGLLRRGHQPMAYSPTLGPVAEDLRRATVPVVSDLSDLGLVPDVIHAQHHLDAMTALLRFPNVPAVFVCHGWAPWQEAPPVFPSIRRYVAVDDVCRDRLMTTPGLDAARVRTVYNGVDLARFRPRAPLPAKPARALVFSNYASNETTVSTIRAACRRVGIEDVQVVGLGSGRVEAAPENILPEFDLVFAKARCALEALAVGCAVVVADVAGVAGLVTPETVARWRPLNFGVRTMQGRPLSEKVLVEELAKYDREACQAVSTWIRGEAPVDRVWDGLEACYAEAVAEGSPWSPATAETFTQAASAYVASLTPRVKALETLQSEHARVRAERDALAAEDERRRAAIGGLRVERAAATEGLRDERAAAIEARRALTAIEGSTTWRLFAPYRRLRARLKRG